MYDMLTINNPLDHGMTHDEIIDRAQKFNPDYVCLADEIGASGTHHTHVYLYSSSLTTPQALQVSIPNRM